jgi:hypothetical protein
MAPPGRSFARQPGLPFARTSAAAKRPGATGRGEFAFPAGIGALRPDGRRLYVAENLSNTVGGRSICRRDRGKVVTKIEVGGYPTMTAWSRPTASWSTSATGDPRVFR